MEQKLAYLLRVIAFASVEIDTARSFISKTMTCDPKIAFMMIDLYARNFISPHEIIKFLSKHKVPIELDEAKMIVEYYDIKKTGKLDFEAFLKAVAPWNKDDGKPKATYNKQQPSKKLEENLVNFFVKELALIRNSHNFRIELHGTVGTHSFEFYKAIDKEKKAEINYHDLDLFLQNQGIILSDAEITSIIQRGNRNSGNFKMTYFEFEAFILPDVVCKRILVDTSCSSHLFNSVLDRYRTAGIYDVEAKGKKIEDPHTTIQKQLYGSTLCTEQELVVMKNPLTGKYESFNESLRRSKSLSRLKDDHKDYFIALRSTERVPEISGTSNISIRPRRRSCDSITLPVQIPLPGTFAKPYQPQPHTIYESMYPFLTKRETFYSLPAHYDRYPYRTSFYPDSFYLDLASSKYGSTFYPDHMYYHPPSVSRRVAQNSRNEKKGSTTGCPILGPKPAVTYKVYDRLPSHCYLFAKDEVEHYFDYKTLRDPMQPQRTSIQKDSVYKPRESVNLEQPASSMLGSQKQLYQSLVGQNRTGFDVLARRDYRTGLINLDSSNDKLAQKLRAPLGQIHNLDYLNYSGGYFKKQDVNLGNKVTQGFSKVSTPYKT